MTTEKQSPLQMTYGDELYRDVAIRVLDREGFKVKRISPFVFLHPKGKSVRIEILVTHEMVKEELARGQKEGV